MSCKANGSSSESALRGKSAFPRIADGNDIAALTFILSVLGTPFVDCYQRSILFDGPSQSRPLSYLGAPFAGIQNRRTTFFIHLRTAPDDIGNPDRYSERFLLS